jgi:mannose-6-phosphate isomerase-like protein (cupin superfamily)
MRDDRIHLFSQALERVQAHGGVGEIRFRRLVEHSGTCHFVDLAVLPPGASIGRHRHAGDELEFYLILAGSGRMWRDGETFDVRAGDLVRNAPGGEHGLENTGDADLTIFVFEVGA